MLVHGASTYVNTYNFKFQIVVNAEINNLKLSTIFYYYLCSSKAKHSWHEAGKSHSKVFHVSS